MPFPCGLLQAFHAKCTYSPWIESPFQGRWRRDGVLFSNDRSGKQSPVDGPDRDRFRPFFVIPRVRKTIELIKEVRVFQDLCIRTFDARLFTNLLDEISICLLVRQFEP